MRKDTIGLLLGALLLPLVFWMVFFTDRFYFFLLQLIYAHPRLWSITVFLAQLPQEKLLLLFVVLTLLVLAFLALIIWVCSKIYYKILDLLGKNEVSNYKAFDCRCRKELPQEDHAELFYSCPKAPMERVKRWLFWLVSLMISFGAAFWAQGLVIHRAMIWQAVAGAAALTVSMIVIFLLWLVFTAVKPPRARIRKNRKGGRGYDQ